MLPAMHLYIIRHGKAEQDSASGRDRDRELAPRGERQAEWLGERLAAAKKPPTLVIASPFARADRTARLVSDALGVEMRHDGRLIVDEPASGVVELIEEHAAVGSLALVGHNPQLERLCGLLANEPFMEMKTGMCREFEVVDPADAPGTARFLRSLRMD